MLKHFIKHLSFRFRQLKRLCQRKFVIQEYNVKRKIINSYAIKYNCNRFVETGTFLGDTVEALRDTFDEIFSIELQEELFKNARERFKEFEHINIVFGDSGKMLNDSRILKDNTLFWLDGHYSSEFYIEDKLIKTAKGQVETPILEELGAILDSSLKNIVILIDDARCFDGTSDYPGKRELRQFLSNYNIKRHQIKIAKDIIRIIPN